MIRAHTHTSAASRSLVAAVAGMVCAAGLSSCSFITKDDLNSWAPDERRNRGNNGGGGWYDSGGYAGGGGGTGDIYAGTYGLYIEATCGIIWDMTGTAIGDLAWDVDLNVNAATDCSGVGDTYGYFEVRYGAAYFAYYYVGYAWYGGGAVGWSTYGYITGGGGGYYWYEGRAYYADDSYDSYY